MTLIQTIAPEKATGRIKEGYDMFLEKGVKVPLPFRLLSASPGLFGIMLERNRYFASHPSLSFSLLAHIRYFVSKQLGYLPCVSHNKRLLMQQGATEIEIEAMDNDPEKSLLEGNEQQMLSFVLKAMADPESVASADIDLLRKSGWTDPDIFDALAQAAGMIDHQIFMEVFKPDF